jgi:hypothetical protein
MVDCETDCKTQLKKYLDICPRVMGESPSLAICIGFKAGKGCSGMLAGANSSTKLNESK